MFLPYPIGPVKGYMIACQFTPSSVTTYSGKAIVGITAMEGSSAGYTFIASPYGNSGKLDLTTVRVKGTTDTHLTYRSPDNEIHWSQANKFHNFVASSGTSVHAFIFSEISSTVRQAFLRITWDLSADTTTIDSYLMQDYKSSITTDNWGQTAGGLVVTSTHMYLTSSYAISEDGNQYQCVQKLAITDVASNADLNSVQPSCFSIPFGSSQYNDFSNADYFDKLIGVITT